MDESEWSQFSGIGEPWNKHTNAAASVDRQLLNQFPRYEEPYQEQKFWVNHGGYQTLNFIPSIATMLFGLMAGQLLMSNRLDKMKVKWLLQAGLICFVISMLLDTSIWPVNIAMGVASGHRLSNGSGLRAGPFSAPAGPSGSWRYSTGLSTSKVIKSGPSPLWWSA